MKSLVPLLFALPNAHAWGTLGHDTVAFIAQAYLKPATVKFAQKVLNDTSSAYLANVATWADSYRYTAEGGFSAPYHYIDALDDPPKSCNVDYERDCPEEGCIVRAVANYTARVKNPSLPAVETQKALKWIIHFLGDIHQPLHVENLDVGGNTISVLFGNTSTNLHHIWDSNMPEKLIGGYSLSDAQKWAATLKKEIDSGEYSKEKAEWVYGLSAKSESDSIKSSMLWATDANSYVCSTVIPQAGADSLRGAELSGAYYDAAIPVIELQIAKAGYRLAAWLNLVVTGDVGVKVKKPKKHGHGGYGRFARSVEAVRVEAWDIQKIEEARRVRRAFGWNCGHEH